MRARTGVWRFLVVGLVAAAALTVGATATASRADDTILNQTQASDPVGDSGPGPDLSGLTVTTYADGTIAFTVKLANRTYLHAQETVQIILDLNYDSEPDLNLSVWPSFRPSYLTRWTGSEWTAIRQLPELVQAPGSFSVRLSLSELQSAAAAPVAPTIEILVAAWRVAADGTLIDPADDYLPDLNTPSQSTYPTVEHSIQPPTATEPTPTTTATATTTTTTTGNPAPVETSPPLTITPLTPLTVKLGKKATLHIALKSHAGPLRLFKVCAHAPRLSAFPTPPSATPCARPAQRAPSGSPSPTE